MSGTAVIFSDPAAIFWRRGSGVMFYRRAWVTTDFAWHVARFVIASILEFGADKINYLFKASAYEFDYIADEILSSYTVEELTLLFEAFEKTTAFEAAVKAALQEAIEKDSALDAVEKVVAREAGAQTTITNIFKALTKTSTFATLGEVEFEALGLTRLYKALVKVLTFTASEKTMTAKAEAKTYSREVD